MGGCPACIHQSQCGAQVAFVPLVLVLAALRTGPKKHQGLKHKILGCSCCGSNVTSPQHGQATELFPQQSVVLLLNKWMFGAWIPCLIFEQSKRLPAQEQNCSAFSCPSSHTFVNESQLWPLYLIDSGRASSWHHSRTAQVASGGNEHPLVLTQLSTAEAAGQQDKG